MILRKIFYEKKKVYIIILAAIIIAGLFGLYFIKQNRKNEDNQIQTQNLSAEEISEINSENKRYMEEVIKQSKNFNEIEIDFKNNERERMCKATLINNVAESKEEK